jgi:hypothetical protein
VCSDPWKSLRQVVSRSLRDRTTNLRHISAGGALHLSEPARGSSGVRIREDSPATSLWKKVKQGPPSIESALVA